MLLGAIVPFWNLYLLEQNYSPIQIGLLGAVLMGTKVVSPYILGLLTDRTGEPMRVIRWSNFIALICFCGIFFLSDNVSNQTERFYGLMFVVGSFTFFWNAVVGQYEAVTLIALGSDYHKYGPIRAWGSIGFILAVSLLGWFFDSVSINQLPVVMLCMLFLIWLSSLAKVSVSIPKDHQSKSTLYSIIKQPSVIGFFIGCFLMKVAHGPYYIFYSIYLDGYGYSTVQIGLLWSVAVLAEFALFFVMSSLINKFGLKLILLISTAAGIIRWVVIAYSATYWPVLLAAQLFHALTFASYHAAAVEWVRRKFGAHLQGQGQALYSAVSFGAGSAVGSYVSGVLWTDQISSAWTTTWILAAVVSAVAFCVYFVSMDAGNEGASTESS